MVNAKCTARAMKPEWRSKIASINARRIAKYLNMFKIQNGFCPHLIIFPNIFPLHFEWVSVVLSVFSPFSKWSIWIWIYHFAYCIHIHIHIHIWFLSTDVKITKIHTFIRILMLYISVVWKLQELKVANFERVIFFYS